MAAGGVAGPARTATVPKSDGKTNEMRPLLLQGHEKAITYVTFNRDGDLLFSCAREPTASVWWADTGERVGTLDGAKVYEQGHNGAISYIDCSQDSKYVITSGMDMCVKLWTLPGTPDAEGGTEGGKVVRTWPMTGVAMCVQFAEGSGAFAVSVAPFRSDKSERPGAIHVYSTGRDRETGLMGGSAGVAPADSAPLHSISFPEMPDLRATVLMWTRLNRGLVVGFSSGAVLHYAASAEAEGGAARGGPEVGAIIASNEETHTDRISAISMDPSKSLVLVSSHDHSATLFDVETLRPLKSYSSTVPLNGAAIHPTMDHVMVGGGQQARDVAKIAAAAARFEARIFHMIFEEELGSVAGHFGPVNTLSYSRDGRSYVSGGEDGFIRLHHLPPAYFRLGTDDEVDSEEVSAAADAVTAAIEAGKTEDEIGQAAEDAFDAVLASKIGRYRDETGPKSLKAKRAKPEEEEKTDGPEEEGEE